MQTSQEFLPIADVLPPPGKQGYFTLFSPRGRMGRAQFFYVCTLVNIAGVLGNVAITTAENASGIVQFFTSIAVLTLLALNTAVGILCCIKRVHDWGKSGVHALKLLIPFYSLVMIFREGDAGLNFYGDRRYNPHIFWNAPLVVLIPTLLTLFFAVGTQVMADFAASWPGAPYQDERNGYTLTVPAGWTREPLKKDADTMQFFSADRKYGMYVTVRPYETLPGYTFAEEDARSTLELMDMEEFFPDEYKAFGSITSSVEQVGGQWFFRMESSGILDDSAYRVVYMGCVVDGYYYGLSGEQYGKLTQAKKDRMDAFMRSFRTQ